MKYSIGETNVCRLIRAQTLSQNVEFDSARLSFFSLVKGETVNTVMCDYLRAKVPLDGCYTFLPNWRLRKVGSMY